MATTVMSWRAPPVSLNVEARFWGHAAAATGVAGAAVTGAVGVTTVVAGVATTGAVVVGATVVVVEEGGEGVVWALSGAVEVAVVMADARSGWLVPPQPLTTAVPAARQASDRMPSRAGVDLRFWSRAIVSRTINISTEPHRTPSRRGTGARSRGSRYLRGWAVLVAALLIGSGCGSRGQSHAARPAPTPTGPTTVAPPPATEATTTTTTTVVAPPSTTPTTTAATFSYQVSGPLTAADVPHTWRSGCPVGPDQLRRITLAYWGFDGQGHQGAIIVNATVVPAVVQVFSTLFADRFPLREMVPEDAYGGDDNAAAAADDTSGFNCRDAVAAGPPQWSVHAYGEAIDVNDVENPYIEGSTVIPPAGAAYANRSDVRPGMAVPGGQLVNAFAAVGWQWGGRWIATPDYQHFSATGG